MKKKKLFAIINPISGIRPKDNIPDQLREYLNHDLFNIEIEFTQYAGHATELASNAVAKGYDYVLAIGGDGTINETAKALIHSDTALGIIPLGSGNGLARHLQIPMETSKAIAIINEQNVISIDYCKANDNIFFCTAGIGFDAWISKKFSEDKHRGGIVYIKNVLTEYLNYAPREYTIDTTQGRLNEKAFLIACANASQYGNNAFIAPGASMQDGQMDITILHPFNHLEAPQLAIQLFTRQITKNGKIETFKDNKISIHLNKEEVMHLDGEPKMLGKDITIQTVPNGLKILTPLNPSTSIIEPIQHAIEEIQYNIISDIKEVVKKTDQTIKKIKGEFE
ncbi:MAG: diacylglycerol kinase family lipid kinase [Bacteroidales bacterium]|nr:diacylglycerol kinase family lipid kinase [Bacteroidales bacterium]